jgi:hypothetical protein
MIFIILMYDICHAFTHCCIQKFVILLPKKSATVIIIATSLRYFTYSVISISLVGPI